MSPLTSSRRTPMYVCFIASPIKSHKFYSRLAMPPMLRAFLRAGKVLTADPSPLNSSERLSAGPTPSFGTGRTFAGSFLE